MKLVRRTAGVGRPPGKRCVPKKILPVPEEIIKMSKIVKRY
jgi:hypothetical protein